VQQENGDDHLSKRLQNAEKKQLGVEEAKLVLDNIINRRRFIYTACDILEYLFRFLCLRSVKLKRFRGTKPAWERSLKKHYHYKEGVDKL
jgi:hypothetical protein